MELLVELQTKVNNKIISVIWEEEYNNKFLRINVNEPNLEKLTIISKEISEYLDANDKTDDEYFLDIQSAGTDQEFPFIELKDKIGQNIKVTLNKPIKDKNEFEGELIEAYTEHVVIKWNVKGQFRKQKLELIDIEKVSIAAKVKKEK